MAKQTSSREEAFERRKSHIGIRMTLLYAIVYGGFVALSVFQPTSMGSRAIFGLNLAVAYGLGLILIAILFALIYNHLVRVPTAGSATKKPKKTSPKTKQKEG